MICAIRLSFGFHDHSRPAISSHYLIVGSPIYTRMPLNSFFCQNPFAWARLSFGLQATRTSNIILMI